MNEPKNLCDVYKLYSKHVESLNPRDKAKKILNETQSAVMRFLLPGLGYEQLPQGRKMTDSEVKAAYEYMKTIPINKLLISPEALNKGFALLQVAKASQNTYGGRVKQLLVWSQEQYWWPTKEGINRSKIKQSCPPIRTGNVPPSKKPLTERRGQYSTYQLADAEISASLQAELLEFYEFLTELEWPGRTSKAITDSSAKTYLKHLRLMLGWLHHHQGINTSELSLNLLVPKVTSSDLEDLDEPEAKKLWQQYKHNLDTMLANYFKFLRENMGAFSPSTRKFKINALSALAKFQYHQEIEHSKDYDNIPVIKVIKKYSSAIRKEISQWEGQKRSVVELDKKWPKVIETKTALSSVRLQILEPLRLECRAIYDNSGPRKGSAIAKSLQRYLAWSFLADMPARRQEEYRNLRINLSCVIERPPEVPANGVYHPLPPTEQRKKRRDKSIKDNYIYKTYFYKNTHYESGIWVLDIQAYKTYKSYGPQSIVIPNWDFGDGSCLYDYIERYLYGWYLSDDDSQEGKWLTTGRAEFEPKEVYYIEPESKKAPTGSWGYFFVQSQVGQSFSSTEFKDLVRNPAQRLTDVGITPHTMRYVWATWAFQAGLTDQQRESLAYAMGHDVTTLLKMYDKCKPDEKRRPIEEAINELLFSTFAPKYSDTQLEQLAQNLMQLPANELQEIMKLLN